jgi:hypothetical protein
MTDADKIKELQEELALYKNDPQKRAYFGLVRILNQQVDYLADFNIRNKIGGKASEDATFARTQSIWENLPKMISSLNELKVELKITKEDEADYGTPFIESVAQTRK